MRLGASILVLIVAACSETPTLRAMGCTPTRHEIGIDTCSSCATAWDEMSETQRATFASPRAFHDACAPTAFATRCKDGYIALDDPTGCTDRGGADYDYLFPDG
jgi:hypothetical protein